MRGAIAEGEEAMRNPIRGTLPGCCARTLKAKLRIRVATKVVTTFLFIAFPNP